jgi:16S rRNA (guanine966-N2)-methyltransferase
MRVIAGSLGGRQFKTPPGRRSHPMAEKTRGGLFNALGDIIGLSLLDAFSGSGAVAYEAISRGATDVVAVEKSLLAYRVIKKNIDALNLEEQVKATRANISTWSDNNKDLEFDVVVCDPPYDAIKPDLLQKLSRHVKKDGIYVLCWPGSEKIRRFDGLTLIKENYYGDSQLVFYKKTG